MDNKALNACLDLVVAKWRKQSPALIESQETHGKAVARLEKKIRQAEHPDETHSTLSRVFTQAVRLPYLKMRRDSHLEKHKEATRALTGLANDFGEIAASAIARNRPFLIGHNYDRHTSAVVEACRVHGENSAAFKQARAMLEEYRRYILETANVELKTRRTLIAVSEHMTRSLRSAWVPPRLERLAA